MIRSTVFSQDGLRQVHEATLTVLETTGVKLEHEKIRTALLSRGARPGKDSETVCLPRALVQECLALAPSTVRFCGRGEKSWEIGPGKGSTFWTAAAMNLFDSRGKHEFDRAELARLSRLVEGLPNLDGVVGVSVKDAPPRFRDVAGFRTMVENTLKHVRVLSFSPESTAAIVEMAAVLLGGESLAKRPVFSLGFTAHGPLRWTNLALDVFYRSAGHGIPVMINGEPMAGGTAPVTLAGAVTVGNAEILAGIVLNQVLEPGRPCIHNLGFAHIMDMRTGTAVTGGPENCLLAAAGAQLAAFYNLPSASWASSDSMLADSQSAVEKCMSILTHSLAGVGLVWGAGTLESELCISYAQTVIDNEIIGQARRFVRGIEVVPESLALDLIDQIGPCGSYLASEHTFEHFQAEFYETVLFCRDRRETWEAKGGLALQDKAAREAETIIARTEVPALSPDQSRELDRIERSLLAAS